MDGMILAFHTIFTAYGFWLPNDPRGSWSEFVRQWELVRFGKATGVDDNRCRARDAHDIRSRLDAKKALKHPPVLLTGPQARAVGRGFARAITEGGYVVHACSILPGHAHLVIARHPRNIRQIGGHLKARATHQLREERIDPMSDCVQHGQPIPSPWSRNAWNVFIDNDAHFRAAIEYVENNPLKEAKPHQRWSFVVPREA